MKRVAATYQRPIYSAGGAWLRDEPVELVAECQQFVDDALIIWTDETRAELVALGLDAEELVGCQEAVEEAFWESEREECRLAAVRQRTGAEVAA